MNLNVKGVGFALSDENRDFIDKKLRKIQFADDYIQDLTLQIKKESKGIGFHLDAMLHFKWKSDKIVSYDCYELGEGVEMLADKIQAAVKKEKSKVVDK